MNVYDVIECGCAEAVRAVLVYTDNPAELLRRKKVRREVLFKYADQEKIAVKPNDEKLIVIQRILHHLGSEPLPLDYKLVCIHYSVPVYLTSFFLSSPLSAWEELVTCFRGMNVYLL